MELWIRSQDRAVLIKVEDIWIDDTDMIDNGYVSIMANLKFSFELGTYTTKERALEVLDEIQDKMDKGSFAKVKNGLGDTVSYVACPLITYEMPEE